MAGIRAGTLLAFLVGTVSLTGCGAGGGVLSSEKESPAPGFTQTIAPRPVTTTPKPSALPGKRVRFGRLTLTLPADWRLAPRTNNTTCAQAPGQTTCLGGALTIKLLAARPNARVDWPAAVLNQPSGWQGSSPTECYAPGAIDPDHADVARSRLTVSSVARLADGVQAAYRQWEVPCTSGRSFTVRLWYLSKQRIVFYILGANPAFGPAYDQIVTTARLGGYQPR